jgi:hypothetical protein
MMVLVENSFGTKKIQEMRHLLKVRGHIRIVAVQVNVIENNLDDVFDFSAGRMELAGVRVRGSRLGRGRPATQDKSRKKDEQPNAW